MGKDLKGKELGKGLTQRKDDKRYVANYYSVDKTRKQQTFDTLREAKDWLAKSKYEDSHQMTLSSPEMTVAEWFEEWIDSKKENIKFNTKRNYRERFEANINPVIGRMRMCDVKPIHCQKVLNQMCDDDYAGSTIKQTLNTMVSMFYAAYENDIVRKSPVTKSGVKLPKEVDKNNIDFFTKEEQKQFWQVAKDYAYADQFLLILHEGMRTGEVIGLTWSCVDMEKREISIEKTLEYRYSVGAWRWETPKTKNGVRVIKMTDTIYEMFKRLQDAPRNINSQTPDEFKDLVFINRTGFPTKNSTYDAALSKRCETAGVKKLSMHDLRHTMATRFCEQANPNYKFLSAMLGHSSIKITLDLYVHLDEATKVSEIEAFSNFLGAESL